MENLLTTVDYLYENICGQLLSTPHFLNTMYEMYGWQVNGFYDENITRLDKYNDTCQGLLDFWEGQTKQEILDQYGRFALDYCKIVW